MCLYILAIFTPTLKEEIEIITRDFCNTIKMRPLNRPTYNNGMKKNKEKKNKTNKRKQEQKKPNKQTNKQSVGNKL